MYCQDTVSRDSVSYDQQHNSMKMKKKFANEAILTYATADIV